TGASGAVDGDIAVVRPRHPAGDGQPESMPAPRGVALFRAAGRHAIEAVEEPRQVFGRNAWPVVGDLHPGNLATISGAVAGADTHAVSHARRVLHGVLQ